jgi:uncharacterized RDD family membrane protein YckC
VTSEQTLLTNRAPRGRRAAAWLIDFVVLVAAGIGLTVVNYFRIGSLLAGVSGYVHAGFWSVLSSHGQLIQRGLQIGAAEAAATWDTIVQYVVEEFVLLALVAFAYEFLTTRLTGRSIGKALLDLRVVSKVGGKVTGQQAAVRSLVSMITDVGLYAVACWVLIRGDFTAAWIAWLVAVVVFWLNGISSQFGARRSFTDRIAGTNVESGHTYLAAASFASRAAHSVRGRTQQMVTSDVAHKAQGVGSESGQQVAEASGVGRAKVRNVVRSDTVKHVGAIASTSGRRVADLGIAGSRKRIAGLRKTTDVYRESRRTQPTAEPADSATDQPRGATGSEWSSGRETN